MSFGRLVRFVKKWLKRDNDCGGLYEEEEDEEEEEEDEEEEEEEGKRVTAEPCVVCVERDAVSCRRDLNRNLRISSSDRKLGLADGETGDRYCNLPAHSAWLYHPPSPFHCPAAKPAPPFTASPSSDDPSSCRYSRRSQAAVCVCEACYAASERSNPRPATVSVSSRTAVACGLRCFVDEGGWERSCPERSPTDAGSRSASGKSVTKPPRSASSETATSIGCDEDGSHLPPTSSTATQTTSHSAAVEKRLGADDTVERHRLEQTIIRRQKNPDHLPVSVALSPDGEEGYTNAQRHLHCWNRRYGPEGVQWRFCPPPNKTICHVAK